MKRQSSLKTIRALLKSEGVVISSISSSSQNTSTLPPSKEYVDCISPSIEAPLLKTSLHFMECAYNSTTNNDIDGGQAQRIMILSDAEWDDARTKHDRLFAKNKAKGEYCDVNPQRVLDDPRLQSLVSGLCLFNNCTPSY